MAVPKKAYKVSNSLVNVGGILYPVTHSFVVKEMEVEGTWLDEFDGEICECYNQFSYGTYAAVAPPMGVRRYGAITVEMTFAVINLEYVNNGEPGWYDYYTGDQFGMGFQRCNEEGEVVPPYDITGWLIGHTGDYNNYSGYHYTGNKEIVSMKASSPDTMFGKLDGVGGWMSATTRKKDLVFWLYNCKITDTTYSGYNYEFIPSESTYAHSDELFLPGQSGCRIISNKYKETPWNRYPGLL